MERDIPPIAGRRSREIAEAILVIPVLLMLTVGCGARKSSLPVPAGVDPILQTVAVECADGDLSSCPSTTAIETLLWRRYAEGRQQRRFSEIGTENWQAKRGYAVKALLELAQAADLSRDSLERCLSAVLLEPDDPVAMVPVGAYSVSIGSREAWIIVCKWEYAPERTKRKSQFRHVRVWALDEETSSVIAEVSCD